jgi:ATP-binding cassette subfamily B (MDR/TAP) protein 1
MGACSKLIMKFNKQAQEFSGTGATLAEEVFSSIRNATALGTQERLAKEYDSLLLKAEYWGFRLKIASGGMMGVMICIMLSDYGLSFWQGSRFLVAGEANVGHILTILLAVTLGSGALGQVMPHFQAFAVATATAGPIFSVIDRPNPEGSLQGKTLGKVNGAIELKAVRHIYPSRQEVVVLNSIDLTIPAGKITALVGASGSGKSTIVGLLERFYTPVGGQIFLDGYDIQTLDSKWLRTQMALVSQEPVLFGTSVFGNISHGLIGTVHEHAGDEKKMELVIKAAKMANAHDFITLLPEGYQTNVGERGFLM